MNALNVCILETVDLSPAHTSTSHWLRECVVQGHSEGEECFTRASIGVYLLLRSFGGQVEAAAEAVLSQPLFPAAPAVAINTRRRRPVAVGANADAGPDQKLQPKTHTLHNGNSIIYCSTA
jgi:hypothetical protein